MKSTSLSSGAMLAIALLFIFETNGQRPGKTRITPSISHPIVTDTPGKTFQGLPLIIDSSSVFDVPVRKSIKPSGAFGTTMESGRIPLTYEQLRWDDALYSQKVWRELDLQEKINQPFIYDNIDENGSTLFADILLTIVRSGDVPAFKDDRFSIPLTTGQFDQLTAGKLDTTARLNPTTMLPEAYVVTKAGFDPKSITRLLLMEEWVFDTKGSRMHCRIIGIAPLRTRMIPGPGQTQASSILFWVNYSDLRPILAGREVYNAKNMGRSRMTWEELFESRMFSSYVTRSTIDNASNRSIRTYVNDPILALLEGDNIKEKIFNYEQDLWSY